MSCLLCGARAIVNQQEGAGRGIYNCSLCGMYVVSDTIKELVKANSAELASFMVRRRLMELNEVVFFSFENNDEKGYVNVTVKWALEQLPRGFSERMDSALLNLARKSTGYGSEVLIEKIENAALFHTGEISFAALDFMIDALEEKGWITKNIYHSVGVSYKLVIKPEGWKRIDLLESGEVSDTVLLCAASAAGESGFEVAMQRACRGQGYRLLTPDYSENVTTVSAALITQIKSAKIVACELSGESAVAYYAAGMAHGLGKPVIRLCKNMKNPLPIETEQLNVLFWDDIAEAAQKLSHAIQILT